MLWGKTNPDIPTHGYGFVIVVNADKVRVTGKNAPKLYRRHSGPSGMKMETFAHLARLPEQLLNRQSRVCCQKIAWGGNCSPSLKFMLESIIPQTSRLKLIQFQELLNNAYQIPGRAMYMGTGRRKSSVARLVPGNGLLIVNGKPGDLYFNSTLATSQLLKHR